jgi:hypothetical protein
MAKNNNPDGYQVGVGAIPGEGSAPPTSDHILGAPGDQTWTGDASGASPVKVNTDALDWFVTQLRAVAPTNGSGFIKTARDNVAAVNILPGTFAHAAVLKSKIDGEKGLKADTVSFLNGVSEALIIVGDALAEVSKSYKATEDDTTFSGDQLQEKMGKAFKAIDAFRSGGQSSNDSSGTPIVGDDGSQVGHTAPPTTEAPDNFSGTGSY